MDGSGGLEDLELREAQREYLDFLDDDQDQGVYHEKVRNMVSDNACRLIVNINDLRRRNEKRAKAMLKDSFGELIAFQKALKDLVASIDATFAKQFEDFHIGFEGSFGTNHVSPRTLTARHLGSLVCVEGIVTKCSLVRPKIMRSVHYCPATKKTLERKYTDLTSLDAFPSSAVYPTKDEENNPLETEYGLCAYQDHQTLTIQEMPEKAPAGQLPRSVDVITDADLVDQAKPGDRVQLVGVYRCLPAKQGGFTSGTFRTTLLVNNVKLMSKEIVPTFSADDVHKIKKFCKAHPKDVFEHLGRSLAPSIHGHCYIKKAILCLLLGGNETILENGSRIRGDINILLIGDPSVAKSQLLRYVLYTAPRAIPTTGRGSTGVGLTAAVTTDTETGERILEAGAMVLADRGVVCIDEFDKMSDMDRTAIHEVMEQGRVTIAKAGIQARLNARCSVLAAANPVYGRYDQYKTPMENIGLQDSLLSRFDLLFIVLDNMDPESDLQISEHVLRMHRYRTPGEQEGTAMPLGSNVDIFATEDPNITDTAKQELKIYEKDSILHSHLSKKEKVVTMEFIRKYIHVAKLVKPVLTQEASDYISEEYSKLRSHDQFNSDTARTIPVTARALETMIRLGTAHAKARMSKTIDMEDAEAALELMQFAYFKKVIAKAFKGALLQAFKTKRSQSVAVAELLGLVNKDPTPAQGEGFQEGEVEQLLGRMQDDNQVMVSEGVVFLI
uniref:DNA replication licensing factor MCM3 n=1 Tax=Gadus morhua TaxID=8049 RepID=A0A8C5C624_GADMO